MKLLFTSVAIAAVMIASNSFATEKPPAVGVGQGVGIGGGGVGISLADLTAEQKTSLLNQMSLNGGSPTSASTGGAATTRSSLNSWGVNLTYVPNDVPMAIIDQAAKTVVTTRSYHFVDPLWGDTKQSTMPTIEYAYVLGVKALERTGEGAVAAAILCAKEPDIAAAIPLVCP